MHATQLTMLLVRPLPSGTARPCGPPWPRVSVVRTLVVGRTAAGALAPFAAPRPPLSSTKEPPLFGGGGGGAPLARCVSELHLSSEPEVLPVGVSFSARNRRLTERRRVCGEDGTGIFVGGLGFAPCGCCSLTLNMLALMVKSCTESKCNSSQTAIRGSQNRFDTTSVWKRFVEYGETSRTVHSTKRAPNCCCVNVPPTKGRWYISPHSCLDPAVSRRKKQRSDDEFGTD